jgi:hypothetical protein
MVFAGVIIEGGIVGYDSNSITGGAGVSVFGIGGTTQYQSDTVTINLRTVSVQSGEILTNVTVTKTVLSYMDKLTLMRWFNNGVDTIESELGGSINESINKAVDLAVQAAVVQTINEGVRKGHWSFKEEPKHVELISQPAPVATPVPAAIKQEPKADPAPEPKKESAKKESASVVGTMYLTDTSFVYKEPNEKSQRTWQLLKGTEFKVTPAVDGWIAVVANDGKKGYVRREVLSTEPIVVPAVVKGNEPSVKK